MFLSLRRLKMKLKRLEAEVTNRIVMPIPFDKEAVVTTKHMLRCLKKNDIGIASENLVKLEVSGFLHSDSQWTVTQILEFINEENKLVIRMDENDLAAQLKIPIEFSQQQMQS